MANQEKKSIWPYIVTAFIGYGVYMSFWTVQQAASIPVQESNDYMLKYQMADMGIEEIRKRQALFNSNYKIELKNAHIIKLPEALQNSNSKRVQPDPVALSKGKNSFNYFISTKDGHVVSDANVTFLLTRPHTRKDDVLVKNLPLINNNYSVKDLEINKAGRYTLQLKVQIGEAVGFSKISAYLKP
jgi:hypothetical protein